MSSAYVRTAVPELTLQAATNLRAPTLASYFLDACDDPLDAASYEKRLSNGLLPPELRASALVDRLPELERRLLDRVAFLDTAISTAERRPPPAALVASVLAESVVAPTAPSASGSAAFAAEHTAPSDTNNSVLRDSDLADALLAANFRQCALAIADIDTSTQEGRRAAFATAFSSGSAIIVRLLLHGGARLAKSHEMLALLHSLRPYLHDYFSYCQTLRADGSRSSRASKWSWTGEANESDAQLKLFMRQDFVSMNWADAPYGAHGLKEVLTGSRIAPLDPSDHYVVVAALEEISSFGASTFAAIGYPTELPHGFPAASGYSWRSFHDLYIAHVKKATSLASLDEMYKWLHKSDTHYRSALREMGRTVRRALESPKPRDEVFGALLPRDALPVVSLLEMQTDLEELTTHREKWDWLKGTKPVAVRVDQLPLLSVYLKSQRPKRDRSPTPPRSAGKRVTFSAGDDSDGGNTSGADRRSGPPRVDRPQSYWLQPLALLYVSGRVWNVGRLARDLKVNVSAKCWPTVLSLKEDKNRMTMCPTPKKTGHTSLTAAAHQLSKPARDLAADYTRVPTPSEAARLQKAGLVTSLRSRSQGKGQPSSQ